MNGCAVSPSEHRRDAAAVRAARMYYLQDLTMDAIAAELGTSRSTVSRLLSRAREIGIVEIRLRSPSELGDRLEAELGARYRVAAHVVTVPETVSDIDRLDRVARTAARILDDHVESNTTIGVAWGSTVASISRHLAAKRTHNTVVVQLNGAGNVRSTGIEYASAILDRFGDAYGATIEQLPVPAVFDDPGTKEAMWRERSTRRVLGIQAKADVAVFGVGSPFAEVPSRVYLGGYLDASDVESLARDGVVGDVATVFYRADGSTDGVAINRRTTGPDLARLRRIPRRLCAVSGVQKLPSLRGALAAGVVTDLVLDDALARALLER